MSSQQRPSKKDSRALAIFGALVVVGLVAAIAIPKAVERRRRAETAEAARMLYSLELNSSSYAEANLASAVGALRFPASAPLTPAHTACQGGERTKHVPTPEMWNHPTWRALNFIVDYPSLYQYEYLSDGKSFTARAVGDLNCDGVFSTFERVGRIDDDGQFKAGAGLYMLNPLE